MLRVFDYNPSLWPSTVRTDIRELTKHIQAGWEHRAERSYMELLKIEDKKR